MPSGGTHLSVDIASGDIAAMLWRRDTLVPVLLDGQPTMPHGIWYDPDHQQPYVGTAAQTAAAAHPDRYLPDPLQRLGAGTLDGHPDPADVAATLLQHVAAQAGAQAGDPVTALTLVIPPAWGPRRRDLLTDAASRAGLPAPVMVTAPAALAATGDPPPAGSCVLVCQTDIHPPCLTVLQTGDTGYRELATTTPATTDLDQTLAEQTLTGTADPTLLQRLTQPTTPEDQHAARAYRQSVRHARNLLAHQDRAPVLLPHPHPPTVVTRDDLHAAAQPLTKQVAAAVVDVLDTADVALTQLAAVIVRQDTDLPGLVDAIAATVGGQPTVITGQPYAAATGALRLTSGRGHNAPTAAAAQLPRTRVRISDLAATAIIAACSIALLVQATLTATEYPTDVRTSRPQLGAAGTLALLAGYAVAHLAPTNWLTTPDPGTETSTGALIRRAYLGAAFLGTITAALYGLAVGAHFGYWVYGPFLRWILIPGLPLAGCAVLIALTAPRINADGLTDWLRRTRPPVLPIALATAGMLLIQSGLTYTAPANLTNSPALVSTIGAALLGIATAWIATTSRLLRIATATVLGLGYAIVVTWLTSQTMIIGFLIVTTWWALRLTAHTLRLAFPTTGDALRRLIRNATR
ncbi:hypothetical protein ACFFWC_23555 [Plantactinospora siamensis]|uniref:Hsp70 protein n=1 Tax=Plantactinospora siamensis TaxID=555372 RepID=A0ABV6NWJ2_9ACTN